MPPDEPHLSHEPPEALRRAAEALVPGAADVAWHALRGGRTNRVWRLALEPGAAPEGGAEVPPYHVVVKLSDGGHTPLFPNGPEVEMTALRWLRGTGLAPRPIGAVRTPCGPALLYRHVAGGSPAAPAGVARTLARLHRIAPPPGLRALPPGPDGLRARLRAVTRALRGPVPDALRSPPGPGPLPPVRPVFLHGDPTPGNAVDSAAGAVLIDWQCPALGDPCDDLAILFSPAMRRLDGLAPLTEAERAHALAAYGDPAVARRLDALAPLHHALLAAHALWRAERGWPGAREAAAAELAALERRAQERA